MVLLLAWAMVVQDPISEALDRLENSADRAAATAALVEALDQGSLGRLGAALESLDAGAAADVVGAVLSNRWDLLPGVVDWARPADGPRKGIARAGLAAALRETLGRRRGGGAAEALDVFMRPGAAEGRLAAARILGASKFAPIDQLLLEAAGTGDEAARVGLLRSRSPLLASPWGPDWLLGLLDDPARGPAAAALLAETSPGQARDAVHAAAAAGSGPALGVLDRCGDLRAIPLFIARLSAADPGAQEPLPLRTSQRLGLNDPRREQLAEALVGAAGRWGEDRVDDLVAAAVPLNGDLPVLPDALGRRALVGFTWLRDPQAAGLRWRAALTPAEARLLRRLARAGAGDAVRRGIDAAGSALLAAAVLGVEPADPATVRMWTEIAIEGDAPDAGLHALAAGRVGGRVAAEALVEGVLAGDGPVEDLVGGVAAFLDAPGLEGLRRRAVLWSWLGDSQGGHADALKALLGQLRP